MRSGIALWILLLTLVAASAADRPAWHNLTAEQRKAKRTEVRARFQKQLERFRNKKAAGPITPDEERRLRHLETLAKRFAN